MELLPPDYSAVARRLLRWSAPVKSGECVTILGRSDSLDFCEALELECRRLGAFPFIVVGSDAAILAALTDPEVTEAHLEKASPQLLAALEKSDLVITTFFERANPAAFHPPGISAQRLRALRRSEEAPSDIIYDGKRRWLGTEIPTKEQAATLGCDWVTLHNLYWAAMQADYTEIAAQADRLRLRLEKTSTLHLVSANGTNLRVILGGRPLECDDGNISPRDINEGALYLNMPSGEVCFAPPENSANGRAFVQVAFWQGRPVRGLLLEFTNGTVRAISADEGLEIFEEVAYKGGGDSAKLGEFGIGLNPAINKVLGFTLLDEKINGTVHLAIGENRSLGGTNNSPIHWDLVLQDVTLLADGEPILSNGKVLV